MVTLRICYWNIVESQKRFWIKYYMLLTLHGRRFKVCYLSFFPRFISFSLSLVLLNIYDAFMRTKAKCMACTLVVKSFSMRIVIRYAFIFVLHDSTHQTNHGLIFLLGRSSSVQTEWCMGFRPKYVAFMPTKKKDIQTNMKI